MTALVVFGLMRWLYASVAEPTLRALIAIAFVAPSIVLAYFLFDDLTVGQVPSEIWRQALCMLGAGVAGLLAFVRLSEPQLE